MMKGKMILMSILVIAGMLLGLPVSADMKTKTSSATRDIVLINEEADMVEGEKKPEDGQLAEQKMETEELHKDDIAATLESNKKAEGDVFKIGDKLELYFNSQEDCYLTLLDFTPSGKILVLFPNKWVEDNFVKGGTQVKIPADGSKFSMKIGGPAGTDVIKALVTNKSSKVIDPENQKLMGPFTSLEDAKAATRDILLIEEIDEPETTPTEEPSVTETVTPTEQTTTPAEQPSPVQEEPLKWSALSLAILTKGETEEQGGFGVAVNEDWTAKMWLDRDVFLTGESVFVKLQSNKKCKLVSLVNKGSSGNERVLLPEGVSPEITPSAISVIPGKSDKFKIIATTPAGIDLIEAKFVSDDGKEMVVSLKVKVEQ